MLDKRQFVQMHLKTALSSKCNLTVPNIDVPTESDILLTLEENKVLICTKYEKCLSAK